MHLIIVLLCAHLAEASERFIRSYTKLENNGTGLPQEIEDKGGYRPEDVIEWAFWILFGACAIIMGLRLWKTFR